MSLCYTKLFQRKVLTPSFYLVGIWKFQSVPGMMWEWHNYDVPVPAKTVQTSPRWKCGTVCTCLCIHDECPPSIPLHPGIGSQLPGGHLQAKSTNQSKFTCKTIFMLSQKLSKTLFDSFLWNICFSLSLFLSLLTFSLFSSFYLSLCLLSISVSLSSCWWELLHPWMLHNSSSVLQCVNHIQTVPHYFHDYFQTFFDSKFVVFSSSYRLYSLQLIRHWYVLKITKHKLKVRIFRNSRLTFGEISTYIKFK